MLRIESLVGDRLYLDHMITELFPFTYENNQINVNYESQVSIEQIDEKIVELNRLFQLEESKTDTDPDLRNALQDAIIILESLKNRLI